MENEKDLLNKDLEATEDAVGLEKLKEDAELLGHEDIVARAQEKIDAINTKTQEMTAEADTQIERAAERGGDSSELAMEVAPIQEELRVVQEETVEKISAVENSEPTRTETVLNAMQHFEEAEINGSNIDAYHAWLERAVKEGIPFDETRTRAYLDKAVESGIVSSNYSLENMDNWLAAQEAESRLGKSINVSPEEFQKIAQEYIAANIKAGFTMSYLLSNTLGGYINENYNKIPRAKLLPLIEQFGDEEGGSKQRYREQVEKYGIDEIENTTEKGGLYDSEEYKTFFDLNKKRREEEETLFEEYLKIPFRMRTRGSFYLHESSDANNYIPDLKATNAPEGLIKRFEEFNKNFVEPVNQAKEVFEGKRKQSGITTEPNNYPDTRKITYDPAEPDVKMATV